MRFRRWTKRLLLAAGILCLISLAYLGLVRWRIAQLESACKAAHQSQRWSELELRASEWAQWRPNIALPWLYAAEAANQQGAAARTATYLYYLPDQDPRTPAGLLELSHLQFGDLNQPLAAADTCRRILRLQPDASEAHRRLIFFLAMSRQRTAMIAEARRAIEVGCDVPETYIYLVGADWITFSNGADLNDRWLDSSPEDELFIVARAYHLVHTLALDAESEEISPIGASKHAQLMDDLLQRFPQNEEVLAYHLNLACTRGTLERAISLLAQAPPSSAADSRFWRFKAWVHEQRDEAAQAEEAYLKALELYPFDWQIHHKLAALYRQTKDFEKVERHQEIALLGKQIMRETLQAPDTASLPNVLLVKIMQFAALCGETGLAERLEKRVRMRQ